MRACIVFFVLAHCTAALDVQARLTVCVNTNICGKANPTHRPGYGWAFRAIDCIHVLGPPWLAVRAGPCFIRCSRGVNARLTGKKESGIRSRDLFRLNSVDECVDMLHEDLDWSVPDDLLQAYRAYSEAVILLDDTFAGIEGVSLPMRAGQALQLLDEAALYVLTAPFAPEGLVTVAAASGQQVALRTAAASVAAAAAAAKDARAAAGAASKPSVPRTRYDNYCGDDLLGLPEEEGGIRERWGALVLALRSRALARVKRSAEALQDAIDGAQLCSRLPEAWEAMADAALDAGDPQTAALAFSELLELQPPNSDGLPQSLKNKRREQQFQLDAIRRGERGVASAAAPRLFAVPGVLNGFAAAAAKKPSPPPVEVTSRMNKDSADKEGEAGGARSSEAEGDEGASTAGEEDATLRAIFGEGYVLPADEGVDV